MSYKQLVSPNLNTTDFSGWCLRFVGNAYGSKQRPFENATQAWSGARYRRTGPLPNAAVPVYFSWTGTIDGVTKNWGDVAIWVPGKGVLGTPPKGYGKSSKWDKTPQDRAKWLGGGAKYLGWSEDVNRVRVAEPKPVPKPAPKPKFNMPKVNSKVRVTIPRTAFVPGTTKVKGTLAPDLRIVRGYDSKYPNRILVNSRALGNNLALALYYTNGKKIEGWK